MARRPPRPRKRPARGRGKRWLILLALLVIAVLAIWQWLALLPDADADTPPAPQRAERLLTEPIAAAPQPARSTPAALPADTGECRVMLERNGATFEVLPPEGEGECIHTDRTVLTGFALAPAVPPVTCPVALGLVRWREQVVVPAARAVLGSELKAIEHFGAYSCRRRASEEGQWSEHATGNAIDIGAFVLADGRRIGVLENWSGDGDKARFLRAVRDGACATFGTVISPDSDADHADHLHFDQKARRGALCQ